MPSELDYQKRIIDSVKQIGGHGRKQSHKFSIGVPDLLLRVPGFVPIEAEIKLELDVTDGFNRDSGLTERQRQELNRANEAVPGTGYMLLVLKWKNEPKVTYLYCVPIDRKRLLHTDMVNWIGVSTATKWFPMRELFQAMKVPKCAALTTTTTPKAETPGPIPLVDGMV
jgi:hypothetical protein